MGSFRSINCRHYFWQMQKYAIFTDKTIYLGVDTNSTHSLLHANMVQKNETMSRNN